MKLEIRIEGKVAELVQNSAYEWELYNPMLQLDEILTSKGLGITLADSPRNNELLNYMNRPNNQAGKVLYKTDKYIGGNLIESGYSYARSGNDSFVLDYTPNLSGFFGIYQLMKLTEIDFGDVVASSWDDTLTNTWDSGGFVLPTVKNAGYYADNAPSGWDGKMNSATGSPTSYDVISPKVPMFFLKNVLKRVADLAGVKVTGDWWEDSRTDKLILFNTRDSGLTVTVRNHLPDVTIGSLLLAMRKLFNLGIFPDENTRTIRLDFNDPKLRAAAVKDWSDRFPRIKRGTAINTDGLLFTPVADSNDGLSSDLFFATYSHAPTTDAGNYVPVKCEATTLLMEGGEPTCEMVGYTASQPDKRFGLRVLSWTGFDSAQPDSSSNNSYGSAVMNAEGLYGEFWAKEDAVRKESFYVETEAALDANDIAWVSECFRGASPSLPSTGSGTGGVAKVHIYGLDYIIEKVIVPSNGRLCLVGLVRV